MAKKLWGTITHPKERNPNNLLGYQKLTSDEIDDMVHRLFVRDWNKRHDAVIEREEQERKKSIRERPLTGSEKQDMIERLSRDAANKAADANRTGATKLQGICNTYAWKGWN